ncbi:MAG: UTP--glucose-1-phosphate uridylyltransferase [Rhodospirillaceae bacterium]|nr:UTP--glucose-1-phosphate uridylyltransferase [Rhodospirillaceae bacterium]|tara:strand:- start:16028 stop:16897 length:870 start_codon:yes stop_codon:yes gene_type:complete
MIKSVRKAVFPVGGMGTRFLPVTKAMPKEMLPVVDKPLIQYAVEEAQLAGIEEFIFVTGRGKTAIEDHFDHSIELELAMTARGKENEASIGRPMFCPGKVAYTRQQEPLGLGHAVWCARELVGDEPFAILLADDLLMADIPCLKQMISSYEETGGNVVAVMDIPPNHTDRYGIINPGCEKNRLVEVRGLVEKPSPEDAPSTLSVVGRYILLPDIFKHLDRQNVGAGGEVQLTDSMEKMIGKDPFHGLRFIGKRFDCGDKIGFQEANIAFAMEREDLRDPLLKILARYSE